MTGEEAIPAEIEAMHKKAAGSSFYAAMRLMPGHGREAMFAIYAFCRIVDDIADDPQGTRAAKTAALEAWRADLRALYAGDEAPSQDEASSRDEAPSQAAFLIPAVVRYRLRLEDFLAVIDGMQMDADADIVAPALAELDLYCDRVASAVGRLSIKVFGMEEEPGFALARHLGQALQLTNILRDLDEDAGMGRLYLPREYLEDAGIVERSPYSVLAHPAISAVCLRLAGLARCHYTEARRILAAKPPGDLRAARLMGAVYAEILSQMERTGWAPPRRRVHLPKWRLVWLALRNGILA
jgi:presqualene diphosphate synthase